MAADRTWDSQDIFVGPGNHRILSTICPPNMSLAWEPHKGTIRDLYLVKDLSRQEVMKIMEERYGFKAE